jgi:hypothetical protein
MDSDSYNIKVIGHSKKDGHTIYVISIEKNGINFTFTERYSELRNLSESMKKFVNKSTFPKFPPKKFFGGDDEKFLTKRQQELNTFFELISKDTEFSSLPPLIKFIKEKKEKNEKMITPAKPNIEKNEINETKKSLIKTSEKDYNNIVKEYNDKFYKIRNYYDGENENIKFMTFFNANKIAYNDGNVKIDNGNENNFSCICKDEKSIESIEDKIKQKIGKLSELYKTFDNIYNTDGIIVPV